MRPKLIIALTSFSAGLALTTVASATTYYVDPATGSMSNAGTSALPWSTLQAVFAANKKFVAGDVILCRSGYHGAPAIAGNNTGVVTIQPDTGASPKLKTLAFSAASNWVVSGLDVCPANAAPGTYVTTANLVNVANGCNNITVENCTIEGTTSIAGWTVADWENNLGTVTDLYTNATNTTFFNDVLTNVGFGIALDQLSTGSMVSHCTVQEFYEDGMRGLSNNSTFAYNLVKDSYVQDSNHDDFLQSWSRGTDGVVGDGTVSNVTVIGNTFISQTDPNQPLPAPPMGVGCYDGMYSGWVVENNLIVSNTYHGISLYGAINCTVINNTAIENPVATVTGVTPWIMIFEHKTQSDGTAWPVASSGNTIRNNIATRSVGYQLAAAGVADHNIVGATYTKYFMNYANFDFAPSATSPLTGAGSSISAPTTDILGYLRTNPYDIGAYKYISPVTYASWAAANIPFGDTTTQSAVTAQDGLNNLYKYALGLNPTSNYNFGAASLPYVKLVPVSGASGADNFLALTFTGVATDVTYTVYATNDPTLPIGSWTQLYTFPSGGTTAPGTVTVTDTQGVSASASTTNKRFMRLFMTNP